MTGILIYLLIGLLFGLVIENLWDEKEEGEVLNLEYRVCAILLWPVILIGAIITVFNNHDEDNFIGPGGATR